MRAIDLALKDLLQLVRDWKSAVFLVAMPIVFTLLFGFAFGGFGGGEADPRLPVGLLDQDRGGLLGSLAAELIDSSSVIRAEETGSRSMEWFEKQVKDGKLAGAVVIPEGYSAALLSGDVSPAGLIVDLESTAGSTVHAEVQAVLARLAGSVQAARLSARAYDAQTGFASEVVRGAYVEEGVVRAVAEWAQPPLTLRTTQSASLAAEEAEPETSANSFTHMSPSMMVQFTIAGLMGAATILVQERKSRALRRLLTTAISRAQIIAGHFLAMVVLITAQMLVLILFGQLALGVDYFREPIAILLVVAATALWTASLGLLIGTLAKNDDQVVFFTLIPMFVLAGMGGAWVPLEITGKTFQTVGHLLPSAWAMDGFENVVVRGLGLESVLLPIGMMMAYAVALFALAAWRFRFE